MRTDVRIDKQQVQCPNASHLGYDKWRAQVGDIITFREADQLRIGRMIGRIAYAPNLNGGRSLRNYILAVVLDNHTLSHTCERWINPADVVRIQSIRNQWQVLDWFLSDDMISAPVNEVRESTAGGWSTLYAHRNWKANIARDREEYDKRHPAGTCICDFCRRFKLNGHSETTK
jgi:hypothetical protein